MQRSVTCNEQEQGQDRIAFCSTSKAGHAKAGWRRGQTSSLYHGVHAVIVVCHLSNGLAGVSQVTCCIELYHLLDCFID